jgi:hypothetical protein
MDAVQNKHINPTKGAHQKKKLWHGRKPWRKKPYKIPNTLRSKFIRLGNHPTRITQLSTLVLRSYSSLLTQHQSDPALSVVFARITSILLERADHQLRTATVIKPTVPPTIAAPALTTKAVADFAFFQEAALAASASAVNENKAMGIPLTYLRGSEIVSEDAEGKITVKSRLAAHE